MNRMYVATFYGGTLDVSFRESKVMVMLGYEAMTSYLLASTSLLVEFVVT